MIPESFIEQLKYASPIEDVIGSYVQLKRFGRNYKGLCPFHSEKTASFMVYADGQSPHYYCFGCGSGGDVITFIRNIENLEYIEALKLLAGRAGMTLPESGTDDRAARLKSRILEINRMAARFFHEQLKTEAGRGALDYLTGRGLTPKTIKRFGLGYSPDTWDSLRNHLRGGGFSDSEMLAAAVISSGKSGGVYDSFRGRAMFPIIDLRGNVIGFGGRAMGERGPKYLNSGDTPVFKKSRNLFALNVAKSTKADTLILAEGYMDVIAIHQAGFDNAVATLGTSLTAEQSRLLASYTKKVAIAYDSDEAGQKATKRAINLLGETDVSVSVLEISGAKDPDEYIKKFGAARFANLISGGKGAIHFEIDKIKAKHDLDSADGKAVFLAEFCRFMAEIEDSLQRDVYVGDTARELDVSRDTLLASIRSLRQKKRRADEKKSAHNLQVYAQDKSGMRAKPRQTGDLGAFVAEEKLLTLLLKHPDAYGGVKAKISPGDFSSDEYRQLYEALAARLEENLSIDFAHLSERLTPALMGRLAGLAAAGRDISFYPGQAEEFCSAILRGRQAKSKDDLAGMTPEEIQSWLKSQRK